MTRHNSNGDNSNNDFRVAYLLVTTVDVTSFLGNDNNNNTSINPLMLLSNEEK